MLSFWADDFEYVVVLKHTRRPKNVVKATGVIQKQQLSAGDHSLLIKVLRIRTQQGTESEVENMRTSIFSGRKRKVKTLILVEVKRFVHYYDVIRQSLMRPRKSQTERYLQALIRFGNSLKCIGAFLICSGIFIVCVELLMDVRWLSTFFCFK